MGKKIKSVKLKHDYRDEFRLITKGTELIQKNQHYWRLTDARTISTEDIVKNKSDIFEIEYKDEPETKSITVKIEYEFNDYMLGIGDVIHAMRDYNEKRVLDKPEYFQNLKVTEIK